jgi:digeranylgeranylglycerophospholipid reductase
VQPKNYDVLIIGAGPSGSEAAFHFAKAGYRTLVLEEKPLNREKACGGGIFVQEIVEFGPLPAEVIERNIRELTISSPNYSHNIKLPPTLPPAAIVKRSTYDAYLQRRAREQGAEFLALAKVVDVTLNKSGGKITAAQGSKTRKIKAKLIIDASGARSLLARKMKIVGKREKKDYVISLQYWLKLPAEEINKNFNNRIEFHFGSKLVPEGYIWIFPKKDVLGVGIGGLAENIAELDFKLKPGLDNFINNHPLLKKGQVVLSQGGIIPSTIYPQIYGPASLLVGDAAGLASPIHGGGIYYARKSGKIAFDFGDKYLKTGQAKHLEGYDTCIREIFYEQDFKWDYKLRSYFDHDEFIDTLVRGAKSNNKEAISFFINLFTGIEPHARVYQRGEKAILDLIAQDHPLCDEKKHPEILPIPKETTVEDLKKFPSEEILIIISYCLKGQNCQAGRFTPDCLGCGQCPLKDLTCLLDDLHFPYRFATTSEDFIEFMDQAQGKYKGLVAVSCPYVTNRLGYLTHKKYGVIGFNLLLKENICSGDRIYQHSEQGNKKEQTSLDFSALMDLLIKISSK